jgi:hypothetical protein
MFNSDRTFDFNSVSECAKSLSVRFPAESFDLGPHRIPRHLFRGECGARETTVPSIDRLNTSALDEADRDQITRLVRGIVRWFVDAEQVFLLADHDALGLVQHLGLPTDYIDFTQCIDVAAAFATADTAEVPPDHGCICVLDLQSAMADPKTHLANLHHHPFLERAQKQQAFGFAHPDFRDLKSPEAMAAFNAHWFDFRILEADRKRYTGMYHQLLDPRSDPTAGLLRWPVNEYVAELGKLRPRVARYCVDKIPMAPLVARTHTQWQHERLPADIEFVLPSDFGFEWNEADERDYSLHLWSEEFPEALPRDFMHQVQVRNDGIFVFPATHHPLPLPR